MKRVIRVLANGVFDVLHSGHVAHLEEARAMGDELIVALTLDEYVNKGEHAPINTWADRAAVLCALRCVDGVWPVRECAEVIMHLKPSVFVKGVDYAGKPWPNEIVKACAMVGAEMRHTTAPKRSAKETMRKILRMAMA